jgi:ferrous iron transport protein A
MLRKGKGQAVMKLYEGEIRNAYTVRSVMVEEAITRRLEALGINEKTEILVLNKKQSGTMIIKVRGTRLALGRRITGGIEVEEARKV